MISLTVNGVAFSYPQTSDQLWGDGATNWASAITTGTLQKASGLFTLTAELDLGASFGLKSLYLKSRNANPSGSGVLRLGSTESVAWRNNANTSDLSLATAASDKLQFNSIDLADISSAQTLTNKTFSGASNTFSSIAYSSLVLSNSIVNADVNASAAIAYSKLNLATSILNADISASAGIVYSKLNLTGAILNADLAGSIARSKLAVGTVSQVVVNDVSGNLSSLAQLSGTLGGTGVSSTATFPTSGTVPSITPNQYGIIVSGSGTTAVVIAPDASTTKVLTSGGVGANPTWQAPVTGFVNPMTTTGDTIISNPGSTATRLAVGTSLQYMGVTSSLPAWKSFKAPTVQVFTAGSGTYTTPANVLYLRVKLVGGGGGGANSGAGAGNGNTGGNTTFGTSLLTGNGGVGGIAATTSSGVTGGAGGTATVTTSGTVLQVVALQGGTGSGTAGTPTGAGWGGGGGSSPYGGAPAGSADATAGVSAIANTGSGGAGAGGGNSLAGSGGGGAGGYLEAIITSPSATYAYFIAAGGTGSGGGSWAGGVGGSGFIEVTEYYQ